MSFPAILPPPENGQYSTLLAGHFHFALIGHYHVAVTEVERRLNAQTAGDIMQIIAHSLAPFLSEF
jgi:hypothetical protein